MTMTNTKRLLVYIIPVTAISFALNIPKFMEVKVTQTNGTNYQVPSDTRYIWLFRSTLYDFLNMSDSTQLLSSGIQCPWYGIQLWLQVLKLCNNIIMVESCWNILRSIHCRILHSPISCFHLQLMFFLDFRNPAIHCPLLYEPSHISQDSPKQTGMQ